MRSPVLAKLLWECWQCYGSLRCGPILHGLCAASLLAQSQTTDFMNTVDTRAAVRLHTAAILGPVFTGCVVLPLALVRRLGEVGFGLRSREFAKLIRLVGNA